jgi:hypothetical protein
LLLPNRKACGHGNAKMERCQYYIGVVSACNCPSAQMSIMC